MAERRFPKRYFDMRLLQSIARDSEILRVAPLREGKRNTLFRVTLSDGRRMVLRLLHDGSTTTELYVLEQVRDRLPVPQVIASGPDWMIYPFLPGELLSTQPACFGVAAEAIAIIGSIQFARSGQIHPDGTCSPFEFGGVAGFIRQQLEKSEVQAWLGPDISLLEKLLAQEENRLAELDDASQLVHGDFNPTNILVQNQAISGILDWEFCHAGSSFMDIGNLLRHAPEGQIPGIYAGIERGGMQLPADWIMRAELMDLTSLLEFLSSPRSPQFKQRCTAQIHHFLIDIVA